MSLEFTLTDITGRLRQGRFPNEQAISQGIVLRVLQELGWDTWDTNIIWPEYQTGEGRVDFALCHPASKPAVFIEVKQPGKAEDAVRQALEYAFHAGVPFVVLTDGKTWSFYLPAEQGSYEDRRVYKLDLFERPPAEAGSTLERYLAQRHVESGEALDTARKEYKNRNRKVQARTAIPEAWRELVGKGDELLVELLAGAVESKSGVRPDDDDVADFLISLGRPVIAEPAIRSAHLIDQRPSVQPLVKAREAATSCCRVRRTPTTTQRMQWSSSFENSRGTNIRVFWNAAPAPRCPRTQATLHRANCRRSSIPTALTFENIKKGCPAAGSSLLI